METPMRNKRANKCKHRFSRIYCPICKGKSPLAAPALLAVVEGALTIINEAEGCFILGKICNGKALLGEGKAMLEKLVEGYESTPANAVREPSRTRDVKQPET
jgi:hypothetical protein